ncbi:MAG: ECF-type sigma factor [Akkermansiaceae bacterium]|jgi:RNA polymerase sigma factor (TIGR02999 family)|nr:ECF-type sigma factor [Akkermansiaceae bacterium]
MDRPEPDTPDPPDSLKSEELLPLVYDELRRLAASRMMGGMRAMTLQPTALVHEAWIRLGGKIDRSWESREHFFNAAALTMRRILMDRARQKATVKHGGASAENWMGPLDAQDMSADERLLLIEESLKRFELENPNDTRIVMLKFFAGLTNDEVAETLGVNEKTVRRKWNFAKARLFQILTEIEGGASHPAKS